MAAPLAAFVATPKRLAGRGRTALRARPERQAEDGGAKAILPRDAKGQAKPGPAENSRRPRHCRPGPFAAVALQKKAERAVALKMEGNMRFAHPDPD